MSEDQLFTEWHRLFEVENRELKDSGEEPLTPAEFFWCKKEDVMSERGRQERLRVERWHATYNAAIAGLYALPDEDGADFDPEFTHKVAAKAARLAHGPLERKP